MTQSVAQYVPMTELDYGSLLCWGINELGKQEEPCVFSILPAGMEIYLDFYQYENERDIKQACKT